MSLLDYCYWSVGTVLGCVAGSLLAINTEGIDFALTALFVSIFVDQWMATKDHAPAVFGVVLSVLALLLIGPDSFLIPAMILITVALTLIRKRIDGKEASDE